MGIICDGKTWLERVYNGDETLQYCPEGSSEVDRIRVRDLRGPAEGLGAAFAFGADAYCRCIV